MATLNGQPIKDTYQGLIKTGDNAAIDATLKFLEDGAGTQLPLQVSTTGINFTGDVTGAPIDIDATNANILAKGVEALGTNNMINISPAGQGIYQPFSESIAIGFNAASAGNAIFIGKFGNALFDSTVVGYNSFASTDRSGIFGNSNGIGGPITNEDKNFIFGYGNTIADQSGITNTHIIGSDITADESNVVMTNKAFKGTGYKTAGFGEVIDNNGNWTGQAIVSGVQSVVAGTNVTVDNTDPENPIINAAGGGGGAGLISGAAAASMVSSADLTPTAAVANDDEQIVLGDGAVGDSNGDGRGVAIGSGANTSHEYGVAIGYQAKGHYRGISIGRLSTTGTKGGAIAIGNEAKATNGDDSIAIGTGAGYITGASQRAISIGNNSGFSNGIQSVQVGYSCTAKAPSSVALGDDARVDTASHTNAVAIGKGSESGGANTVALGPNVTSIAWTDSATVNQLAIVNFANLDYADDTAAAAGGVPLGGVYHTTGTMKIRIA